ncbi:MAG: isoamylase early set domain-containing protein, partial [Candidatus Omnitrophica bacterium]|nr:isoamylase early set domain-containing protein [Candidatus Omnitrophota bacterium]
MKSQNSKPAFKTTSEKNVTFEFYAPSAKEVKLGGDFNQWNPSKFRLKKAANGNWSLTLKLKPGRYEYRYLVDGNWENDQRPVGCVPNAFGSWNC